MTQSSLETRSSIVCVHCGAPIVSRDTLAVAGHGLRPMHADCYAPHAAEQPWYRKPGWPVNRWSSLLWFNALLLGIVSVLHFLVEPIPEPRLAGVGILLLIANSWQLIARLISYVRVERHLPPRADANPSMPLAERR